MDRKESVKIVNESIARIKERIEDYQGECTITKEARFVSAQDEADYQQEGETDEDDDSEEDDDDDEN